MTAGTPSNDMSPGKYDAVSSVFIWSLTVTLSVDKDLSQFNVAGAADGVAILYPSEVTIHESDA